MSTTTQTYLVETVFQTVNKASQPANEIQRSMEQATRATQGLMTVLKGLGAAFVGSRVFSEAKKAFIDYNRDIENHKTVLAGMLTMYTGNSIEKTWDRAGVAVSRFEEMAKKSSLTTADLVQTAAGLTRPLLQAGLSMTQIEKMTFGVANAAKAFGMNGAVVSMDIEQALTTTVGQRDRFARNILAQKGIDMSAEKFNALSLDKRVDVLQRALTSKSITDMAKKQGEDTFGGVMSTLEDNFQIAMSKIGLPLFKAITEEVKTWNAWIEKNQRKIADIGREVASTLVSGFKMIKDVFSWLYNHADTLIAIAKAYATIKIGSAVASGAISSLGSIVGGGAGVAGFLTKKWTDGYDENGNYASKLTVGRGRQAVGGLGGAVENAGLLSATFATSYAIAKMADDVFDFRGSLSKSTTVNGKLLDTSDRVTKQFVVLQRSMDYLDKSALEAGDRLRSIQGAGGSQVAANLVNRSEIANQQVSAIRKLMAEGLFDSNSMLGNSEAKRRGKLEATKLFDSDEIAKIIANPEKMANEMGVKGMFFKQRESEATKSANLAWETIPEEMRKTLDQQKVTAALMSKVLELMPKTNQGIILSKDIVADVLKQAGADDDMRGAKSIKQNVNITIQRVMAKDPNRWIAEMDDEVSKRTRNPTRARNSWRTSVK